MSQHSAVCYESRVATFHFIQATLATEGQEQAETVVSRRDPFVFVYSELIKLDDLHKRGILSQEEFDAQKKKLLGSY
jgi:hypothetical protein